MKAKAIRSGILLSRLRETMRGEHLLLSVLAVMIGLATGGAIVLFRESIDLLQGLASGAGDERTWLDPGAITWWRLLLMPAAGGLLVGLLLRYAMPGRRPQAVADVIAASALQGGRMDGRSGIMAAVVSALSLGFGASVGREGPAVHIGGSIGGWLAGRLQMPRTASRTLLGCGVAAAVAASFNAPLAGALFANEVVIGHYALRAFAPIVIASVAGTVVSRVWFGNFPAFVISHYQIASLWEFPAFLGLGLVSAGTAILLMHAVRLSERQARRLPLPDVLRPAVGGLLVGFIALLFPQVLGVGYAPTDAALSGGLPLLLIGAICLAKIAATAISLGFGFGGGIFSPALVVGATLGGAYGLLATQLFPELSSGSGAYAMIGMGAVAAAVLGAPISTTLIVFELTGDYTITLAVMIAVVVASLVTQQFFAPSFFVWQLEQRGLIPRGGFERTLLRGIRVGDVMTAAVDAVGDKTRLSILRERLQQSPTGIVFVTSETGALVGTVTLADLGEQAFDGDADDLLNALDVARRPPPVLQADDTLAAGLDMIDDTGSCCVPVIAADGSRRLIGCLREGDALRAYNRLLVEQRREERGE